MKISLIIPAYNEEKYIGRCLESLQKYGAGIFEIIVVNNNSTDKTSEIARGFTGIKVICEKEKGPTHARQRGYLESTGDIIAYIDADTFIVDGWVEKIVKTFSDNKNTVCLSGPFKYYDVSKYQKFLAWIYWTFMAHPAYWITGHILVGGNFAIRREALQKLGGFDTSVAFYGDDTNLARRASKLGKVKFDFDFIIYTSARRMAGQGLLKTTFLYASNFVSETIFHRPTTKKYKDVR
jgi:glycosyltransferase involved in cell wall biosynthesis